MSVGVATHPVHGGGGTERNQQRWNANPYVLDGGSGMNECDPGAWLLPYWMGVYHGLIRA